jgi:hypothetical protein
MIGTHHSFIKDTCVDEELIELHVLLRERPDQIVIMQSSESEHRLTIKLGIV